MMKNNQYVMCAKFHRDDGNRPCTERPQYESNEKYWWCCTERSGGLNNWGVTHYPVCFPTRKICVDDKVPRIDS